jgi:hypothetical protein
MSEKTREQAYKRVIICISLYTYYPFVHILVNHPKHVVFLGITVYGHLITLDASYGFCFSWLYRDIYIASLFIDV